MNAGTAKRGEMLVAGGARFARSAGWLARLIAPGFERIIARIDAGLDYGRITGTLPDGTVRVVGGRGPGPDAVITIHDWRAFLRLVTNGSIGWYQAWEAGEWSSPDPVPIFDLFMRNASGLGNLGRAKGWFRLAARAGHWLNRNTHEGAQRNIHAHYDLGNDFYSAWLDPTMTYSSALSGGAARSLEQAQQAKIAAIAERLALSQGAEVLEIGCGWGALSRALATDHGAQVTAISLSDAQLGWCRDHAGSAPVRFLKQDYRDTSGQFDAICSVEMVEALGREYWPTFMDCIARNLKPGGRAAIQYISIRDDLFDAYAASADFIQAYIFPGGMLIRTSEFKRLAAERGLSWHDQADFGQDYAETLRLWRERFDAAVDEDRLPDGFDQHFVDLWRYYLQYCEGGFRGGGIDVHQVTLVKGE